ncbi:MAG: hypothetical protein RLP44_27680 [Aggregatilineales bacterium]
MILMVFALAGCGGSGNSESDLPTRVTVPDTSGGTAVSQAENADSGPTLPATWTLTPSATLSLTPSITGTLTVTPSLTITDTPRPTDTPTPLPTREPGGVNSIADLIPFVTPVPTGFLSGNPVQPTLSNAIQPTPVNLPTVTPAAGSILATPVPISVCQFLPTGGFGQIVFNEPNLPVQIGCPVGSPPVTLNVASAVQTFERGIMIWVETAPGAIYVFYNTGTFQRFDDTYNASTDPVSGGETPPNGLFEPVRGFGKVWRTFNGVRDGLGWATGQESGTSAVIQDFLQGRMMYVAPRTDTFIIISPGNPTLGNWRTAQGTF